MEHTATTMQRWAYEVVKFDTTGFWVSGNVDEAALRSEMNRLGEEGWELTSSFDTDAGARRYIILLFKRPVR